MLTIQNTESMFETQTTAGATDVVDTKAGVQRLELTLKKISEKSNETLQAVPLSSACTSRVLLLGQLHQRRRRARPSTASTRGSPRASSACTTRRST